FGANYEPVFATNGNIIYIICTTAVFLIAALVLKRSPKLAKFWGIAYAFFIASAVNLVSYYFAGYITDIVKLLGVRADENAVQGLDKVYDTLLVVIPVVVLTLAAGADMKSIYLSAGNNYRKWGLGIGVLVMIDFFSSALIFYGMGYTPARLGTVILWGLVFSLSNSLLEELWIRGIMLKKLVPLIGAAGAVLLTSITFGTLHFLGVAYLPATVIPIFVINTFAMGIACGILMVKTDSIWGAYLIHAAADLFLFIATLAAH
ncbi:MAG: CPBP family intramembrane glutamic endopeptidase, partial [Acidobacteriaceae bacterium]